MSFDVAIIGAGIAGASLAAELAPHARVLLVEGEDAPGYHATGRSAAFWSETYGGPGIQPLTSASGPTLRAGGFLQPLGSIHVGREADRAAAHALLAAFAGTSVMLEAVDPADQIPGIRDGWTVGVWEPSCAYIDVGGLHASCLARARAAGATLVTSAGLRGADRSDGRWHLVTAAGRYTAETVVNAAGAWADQVARVFGAEPLGIAPFRRTMAQLRVDPPACAGLPHVAALNGTFYFKPEAGGRVWLSPHDEIPTDPCDAAPDELDVAIAIDRLESAVDWRVEAVERRWAGLRSFAPDRLPVFGFDPVVPGLFWCAGQGGFGIQTAPAAATLSTALLLQQGELPPGVDPLIFSPGRFRRV
ncbi:NAD(P)/FAD-dependent oxidoreductase [Sphingomonas aerophila]|jgi:D-arginine dehydrogenase|uniref:D-arginine dehydrogenase n=1 Tax=Sphingomonas aerophila TaxID=1344948 RepID=A0A7W9EV83_9SPHN|nr:FAD-binding oxidoreductase [Sphingomonas aerophila]MBB5715940.1 D-arginine dehydrogenase [Sphingomonas aerophila]